jgi:hypothetical protein
LEDPRGVRRPLPAPAPSSLGLAALFLVTSALAGCGGAPAPTTAPPRAAPAAPPTKVAPGSDEAAAREAGAALDAWHDAAARSDEAAYFALFDEEGVFLGTDATERWDKAAFRAYAKKPFANGKGWTFQTTRRALHVSNDGTLAFFDEDLASPRFPPTRGSGVLVRRGDAWKVLQYVLSMTIPNDRFDAVKEDATARIALAPEGKLAALGWLAGTWASEDLAVELTWSQARASTMVGTLRVADTVAGAGNGSGVTRVRGVETHTIDALRIEASDRGASYTAERKGRAALRYEMEPAPKPTTESKGDQVTFVDAPNQVKLTFSRDADGLRIVVERKGKVEETTLLRRAVFSSADR